MGERSGEGGKGYAGAVELVVAGIGLVGKVVEVGADGGKGLGVGLEAVELGVVAVALGGAG